MHVTKTDYLEFLFCQKNLWLKKHKPELFVEVTLSEFEKKIIEEGNAADEYARHLFPDGVLVDSFARDALQDTQAYIEHRTPVIFQATFQVENFLVRTDILVFNADHNAWELYEVKATNDVKREKYNNHVKDVCFQKIVVEKSGIPVHKCGVIHLNPLYQRGSSISYRDLFIIDDISEEVNNVQDEVLSEMHHMQASVAEPEVASGCACIYRGRSNHCTTFAYSNPEVPSYSIHDLVRIGMSPKKITNWVAEGIFALTDIPDTSILNKAQQMQVAAHVSGQTLINRNALQDMLQNLRYPLYFFDYEGFAGAIPQYRGFTAFEHVPFQYSLHIVHKNGLIEHREHLVTKKSPDITKALVEQLVQDIGATGTVIAWHASYEIGRNNTLARLYPQFGAFFADINDRMFDLESIFTKQLYVHPDFKGKTSIKKILPVLVPELSYADLAVQAGDQAMERWEWMLSDQCDHVEADHIRENLLTYCKQDTWAMVRIWQVLCAV